MLEEETVLKQEIEEKRKEFSLDSALEGCVSRKYSCFLREPGVVPHTLNKPHFETTVPLNVKHFIGLRSIFSQSRRHQRKGRYVLCNAKQCTLSNRNRMVRQNCDKYITP